MVGLVKALRAQRKRALEMAPPHLCHYFDDRLLVGSWYPEEDFRDLTLLLGRLTAPSVQGNVWRMIGTLGAQRDFAGIYAAMIRKGQPEWTLRFFPDGWRQYRDSGRLVLEELREGFAVMTLHEYPVMCRALADVNAGYFEAALTVAGAVDARVDVVTHDSSSARWELSWRGKAAASS